MTIGDISLERMVAAVEKVRNRLLRATRALESSNIAYAVAGGNAVAAWVSRVDEAAVRNTQDVDILLRRENLEEAKVALAAEGFVFRHSASIDMFLDGPDAKARDAVHVVLAGEKVRPDHPFPAPSVDESESAGPFRILTLDSLVRMKLTAFRRKDQVHLLDLMEVGLLDASWTERLPEVLATRFQELLDHPDD